MRSLNESFIKAIESFRCRACRHPFGEDNPLFPKDGAVIAHQGRNMLCAKCRKVVVEFRWSRWIVFGGLALLYAWIAGGIVSALANPAFGFVGGTVVFFATCVIVAKDLPERRLSVIAEYITINRAAQEKGRSAPPATRPASPPPERRSATQRAPEHNMGPLESPSVAQLGRPGFAPRSFPAWLDKIAGPAATTRATAVSWPFIPSSPLQPGASVDDGLRALARRSPDVALATWRRLIEEGGNDPEPYLFASMLILTSRRWWGSGPANPGSFDKSLFSEAVLYSQEACRRDPKWPDAWYAVGEWLLEAAMAEGERRGEQFSLENMLTELHVLGLAVECLRKAAELDGARFADIVQSFGFYHRSTKDLILKSAGQRASEASVRSLSDILRRSGLAEQSVRRMPVISTLVDELRGIHGRGDCLVFVCPSTRCPEFAEAFQTGGLNWRPKYAFGAPGHEIQDWYREIMREGIGFVSSAALAVHPCDWFPSNAPRHTTLVFAHIDRFSLCELMGALTWTSPSPGSAHQLDRVWYLQSDREMQRSLV